jgi:hypothetical protein
VGRREDVSGGCDALRKESNVGAKFSSNAHFFTSFNDLLCMHQSELLIKILKNTTVSFQRLSILSIAK